MTTPLNPRLAAVLPSPIMEAQGWARAWGGRAPLLNLAQAAPVGPPPAPIRKALAEAAAGKGDAHLYGAVLGDDALRGEIAAQWSADYGPTEAANVAVTAGCNQAFCVAVQTVAQPGDEVILPCPWYFNHKMWLDMIGVAARPLAVGDDCLPSVEAARALIGPKTRAIALVTPNNPTGAVYPSALLADFAALAREAGLALILDETYRDYLPADRPPHDLLAGGARDPVIQLYSFSKLYRLTGHRIGAMVADAGRVAEAEKILDTMTICPARLGQIAALAGLAMRADLAAAERAEFDRRADTARAVFADNPGGWRLKSVGAYFAYVEHPFDASSDEVSKALAREAGVLILPGTMFGPTRDQGGDGTAERTARVAFANVDAATLAGLGPRLAGFSL